MSERRASYNMMEMTMPQSNYVDVPYPDGSLAFRLDTERMIVEIQRRGIKYYFDLRTIYAQGNTHCK